MFPGIRVCFLSGHDIKKDWEGKTKSDALSTSRSSHRDIRRQKKGFEYQYSVHCHVNSRCTVPVEKLRHSSVFFPIDISAVRLGRLFTAKDGTHAVCIKIFFIFVPYEREFIEPGEKLFKFRQIRYKPPLLTVLPTKKRKNYWTNKRTIIGVQVRDFNIR